MNNDPPLEDPVWLSLEDVTQFHNRVLDEFGGASGIRDPEGLEGAVNRPRFLAKYGDPTLCECAARYGIVLAQSQVLVDGNKRTSVYSVAAFLRINGYLFRPPEDELEPTIRHLSTQQLSDEDFTAWILRHTEPAAKESPSE